MRLVKRLAELELRGGDVMRDGADGTCDGRASEEGARDDGGGRTEGARPLTAEGSACRHGGARHGLEDGGELNQFMNCWR